MKTSGVDALARHLDPHMAVLLEELRAECETVQKLLAQLELPGLQGGQAEEVLGDLSAAILHLQQHTQGLDERLDDAQLVKK